MKWILLLFFALLVVGVYSAFGYTVAWFYFVGACSGFGLGVVAAYDRLKGGDVK